MEVRESAKVYAGRKSKGAATCRLVRVRRAGDKKALSKLFEGTRLHSVVTGERPLAVKLSTIWLPHPMRSIDKNAFVMVKFKVSSLAQNAYFLSQRSLSTSTVGFHSRLCWIQDLDIPRYRVLQYGVRYCTMCTVDAGDKESTNKRHKLSQYIQHSITRPFYTSYRERERLCDSSVERESPASF